jgi:hypothetical protein
MTFELPADSLPKSTPISASGYRRIFVINPLGVALRHYTAALVQHLTDAGIDSEEFSVLEPSQSGKSRLHWLAAYTAILLSVGRRTRKRHSPERVLVTWPVLGFLDLLIVKVLCGNSGIVVYHDPRPLVRSLGSSRTVAALVGLVKKRPAMLVHSKGAAQAMRDVGLADGLALLPHPMFPAGEPTDGHARGPATENRPRVRVLGQYKADRDVDLLRSLAGRIGSKYCLDIVGRGWPTVPGWNVDARFVSEGELDELIATSGVVIIPYKRFYQSGIAIRALEHAVPVVGRAETSLRELYGPHSRLLITEEAETSGTASEIEAWAAAIEHALEHGRTEASLAGKRFHAEAARGWTSLGARLPLQEIAGLPGGGQ